MTEKKEPGAESINGMIYDSPGNDNCKLSGNFITTNLLLLQNETFDFLHNDIFSRDYGVGRDC